MYCLLLIVLDPRYLYIPPVVDWSRSGRGRPDYSANKYRIDGLPRYMNVAFSVVVEVPTPTQTRGLLRGY
jgi:hypothetical protein